MRNAMAKKTAGLNIFTRAKDEQQCETAIGKKLAWLNIFRRTKDEERCETLWDSRLQDSRRNAIGNRRKKLERVEETDALDVGYVRSLSVRVHNGVLCNPRGLLHEHELQRIHP